MAISEGERHLAEFQFGMTGHFFTALFVAMVNADETNLNRLSLAFPDEVNAYRRYRNENGYWQRVEAEWRAGFRKMYARADKDKGPPVISGAGPDVEGDKP